MKSALALIGAVIVLAGATISYRAVSGQTKQERLSAHIAWVLAEGDKSVETRILAQLLGIGDGSAEPAVFIEAFERKDPYLGHAFEVVKDSDPVIILIVRKDENHSIVWRTSKSGDIIGTMRIDFSNDKHYLVANADYADLFADELKYWDRHVPEKYKPPQR